MDAPPTARQLYRARMRRVIAHIEAQLEAPGDAASLNVAQLSAVAAFSPFHFHRQFSAAFGLGAGRYVLLRRLKRAAHRLAFRTELPILEIALDAGYGSPEAFARVFKRVTGQTPSAFRAAPDWMAWQAASLPAEQVLAALAAAEEDIVPDERHATAQHQMVEIVNLPAMAVAVMEHRGDPLLIGETIRRFIAWRKARGLTPPVSATYNIFHDDPETTAPADFRLDLCAGLPHEMTGRDLSDKAAGIVMKRLPAGRCARLRVTGGETALAAGALLLYRDWLPQSGEEARDFPLYCQRVTFFPDVAEGAAIIDLFLPLADQPRSPPARQLRRAPGRPLANPDHLAYNQTDCKIKSVWRSHEAGTLCPSLRLLLLEGADRAL